MMEKILNKIHYFVLVLVPFGWLLNGKYYYSRFRSEGFEPWLSIILPIILVCFATGCFSTFLFLKKQKNRIYILFLFIYIILAFYSINCTTAGQYWDQSKINKETKTLENQSNNNQWLIDRIKKKISEKEDEYKKLNSLKDASLTDLSDLYNYKNTTKTVEQMKDDIEKDISEFEKELNQLIASDNVSLLDQDKIEQSKTLYEFYSNLFFKEKNIENPLKVQFVFQVILSIIIEMIAQISITIFVLINNPENKSKYEIKITKDDIRYFAVYAFEMINKGEGEFLVDSQTLMQNIIMKKLGFDKKKYEKIMLIAEKDDLIRKKENGYIPYNEYTSSDFFYKRMCEILKLDKE